MTHTTHHIHRLGAAAAAVMLLASCNDWLSVQPQQQVEDSELFSSQTGYKEALAGVYSSMVNDRTYAKEMAFGALAVLGHEWDNTPAAYQDLSKYNYESTLATQTFDNIWQASYNSIANANNILAHIDADAPMFTGDNMAVIKGEALALRAWLHFGVLRCFGVSHAVNPSQPAIPYVTDFTYRVFPQLTVAQATAAVLADLAEAERLLEHTDPIVTGRTVTELDDAGYLMNRTVHLNYYAVKALQARVHLWAGDWERAAQAARTVISSGRFDWATQELLSNGGDPTMAPEQIFALNNVNLSVLADNYFNENANSTSFSCTRDGLLAVYDNEATDLRFLFNFKAGELGDYVNNRYCTKYSEPTRDEGAWYRSKMPMLRLGEMHLILAECDWRQGGTGLDDLNTVHTARNVPAIDTAPASYPDLLVKEYRRELLGEGQLFYLLKRLNAPVIPGADIDPVATKAYTFPLPLSETETSERQPNR